MNRLSRDLDHVLDHTGHVWPLLQGERIFFTGGTGFVGSWLLESLLWANRRLNLDIRTTVLTRNPAAFLDRRPHLACDRAVTLVAGDIRTFRFPEGRFGVIVHGAVDAREKFNREDPEAMLDTIVDGTRRVLKFARTAGARRFLLLSSGAVYGKQPPEVRHVPEIYLGGPDPMDARAAYAEGKRAAELLCRLHSGAGMECLIARCFAFVGPYLPLDAHFAIGNFIRDCINDAPIEIRGDGTPVRSYLYAADLAIWLWTILARGESCRPYNVGSEDAIDIGAVASKVQRTLGGIYPVHLPAVSPCRHSPERYVPDTARARNELGLRQWIALDEAILRTAEWHGVEVAA